MLCHSLNQWLSLWQEGRANPEDLSACNTFVWLEGVESTSTPSLTSFKSWQWRQGDLVGSLGFFFCMWDLWNVSSFFSLFECPYLLHLSKSLLPAVLDFAILLLCSVFHCVPAGNVSNKMEDKINCLMHL